jgi:Flagellar biosynthesis/type III secretory pathway protein
MRGARQAIEDQLDQERETFERQDREHGAQVRERLDVLERAARAAREREVPVLRDAEDTLVAGALELAEALLGVALEDHETSLRAALHRALLPEARDEILRVRLHPDDVATLSALRAEPGEEYLLPRDVEVVPDPELDPGDAVAEVREGVIDARLSRAVARVREVLGATP